MKPINLACGSVAENPLLKKVLKQAISKIDIAKILSYESPLGMIELRQKIVQLYQLSGIDENNVIITSSAQQALGLVIDVLQQQQVPQFFMQEPAYFGIIRLLQSFKVKFQTFSKITDLVKNKNIPPGSVIYLTSNFHNPTGQSISYRSKKRLINFSQKYNLTIIEDNPYDFIFFGKKQPSTLFQLCPEKVVYLGSFSKMLAPGLRIGYVIANKEMISQLKSQKITQDIFTSTVGQQICSQALKNADYLSELRCCFKSKRNVAVELLKTYFSQSTKVSWQIPAGGIFILIKFPLNVSSQEIIAVAQNRFNLFLDNDRYAHIDGQSRNRIRINFVSSKDSDLKQGIKKLYLSFKEVANGKMS